MITSAGPTPRGAIAWAKNARALSSSRRARSSTSTTCPASSTARYRYAQRTDAFAALYAIRAGTEGPLFQGVRRCGLRRARYRGLAKTHLQHIATATALNFARLAAWLAGEPIATTRTSRFAALAPDA